MEFLRFVTSRRSSRIVGHCLIVATVLFLLWIYLSQKTPVSDDHKDSLRTQFNDKLKLSPGVSGLKRQIGTFLILDYTRYRRNKSDVVVGNCRVTQDRSVVNVADAVAVFTRHLKSKDDLPSVRHPWQRWVWVLDESPYHKVLNQPFTLADFDNVYNWTMTYRKNSDVYIPYGRTRKKQKASKDIPDLGKRDKLVAAVISNCIAQSVHNRRMDHIRELHRTVPVTVYGGCGKPCPGYKHEQQLKPCPELHRYKFYLAFENSNCKEYITEKLFANGFDTGAVPVVMGAPKEDYVRIAPPNSFIYARDFSSPEKLGQYLEHLSKNLTAYMEYHQWRKEYTTEYRIQFIHDSVWKPLCKKLNERNNQMDGVSSLSDFWTVKDCDETPLW